MKKKRKKLNLRNLNIEAILINSAKSAHKLGFITETQRDRDLEAIYSNKEKVRRKPKRKKPRKRKEEPDKRNNKRTV